MIALGQLRQHIQALNSVDDNTRQQAIHTLRNYEEQDWRAVPVETLTALVELLQRQLLDGTKRTLVRQEILIVLGNIGAHSQSAVGPISELLQDGVPDGVREEAATALGKIGKKASTAAEPLVIMLARCRTPLAMRVIDALIGIGGANPKVRESLTAVWSTPDQSQYGKVHIALALSKLKLEAEGVSTFLARTLVGHQDSALRKLAADALGFCNKNDLDVVPAMLTAALHDKDETVRERAEAGLTQLHLSHEKAVTLCAKQLADSSFAEAALRNSGPLAVPALIEAVASAEPGVSEKAIRILSSLGEQAAAAVPMITKALHNKDMHVRLAAAKGLWNITKNAEVPVPALVALLEEKWPADHDGEARRRFLQTVIEALGRIGPPAQAAAPALKSKTKDKNRLVSESAANALKVIAANS